MSLLEPNEQVVARKLAQVGVENETRIAQRARPQVLQRGDIQKFEHRVHGDALAAAQHALEAHRYAVDQDQVDFGVRHAQGFDRVLDRARSGDAVAECNPAPLGRQKIVQFFVEAEFGRCRGMRHRLSGPD